MKQRRMRLLLSLLGAIFAIAIGTEGQADQQQKNRDKEVSPVRQIEGSGDRRSGERPSRPDDLLTRTIDGSGNHPTQAQMNAAHAPLVRTLAAGYGDGVSALAGSDRPSARAISNTLFHQTTLVPNAFGTSDFLWQWGQFLDHDLDLTDGTDPPELAPIAVPTGDPFFDPEGTGEAVIVFNRSIHTEAGDSTAPREQINEITGWIDASNVYGSDSARAEALRTLDGTGRLRVGPGDLLPDDDTELANATGGSRQVMFLAGDVRANEQVALIAMHTLFVREHNRLADAYQRENPRLSGDETYERARAYVGGLMQVITYGEFLPALLGRNAIPRYAGYDPGVDAGIANAFSTAAYRFGHSALSPQLLRLERNGEPTEAGPLALRNAFFSPDRIRDEGGIEPILRGLARQPHQRIDAQVIDDVRNFLFGPPGAGGFDLVSLNLQRGRDHGLPSYIAARAAYGLPPVASFEDVSSDPEVQGRLAEAYGSVEVMDLWAGGLSEDPEGDSQLGPLFTRILAEQFVALRDGDRFWYERALPRSEVKEIAETRLSDVIRRNTTIGRELPRDVFRIEDQDRSKKGDRSRRGRR